MVAFGGLRRIVIDFGELCLIVTVFGELRRIVIDFGKLCRILPVFGKLCRIVTAFGSLPIFTALRKTVLILPVSERV